MFFANKTKTCYNGVMEKTLKQYLEKDVLNEKITAIKKIGIGASSDSYRIETRNGKVFAKFFKYVNKNEADNTVNLLKALAKNRKLKATHLRVYKNKPLLKFKNFYGIILSFIDGKSIPSAKITKTHMSAIAELYKTFLKTDFKNVKIPSDRTVEKQDLIKTYKAERTDFLSVKIGFRKTFYKILLKPSDAILGQIEKKKAKEVEKRTVIHGDFQNNNILFTSDKEPVLLDFDEVRYGHAYEDLSRYILALMHRLPLYRSKRKLFKAWVSLIEEKRLMKRSDWEKGIDLFYLKYLRKPFLTRKKSRSVTKMVAMIPLCFSYKRLMSVLQRK